MSHICITNKKLLTHKVYLLVSELPDRQALFWNKSNRHVYFTPRTKCSTEHIHGLGAHISGNDDGINGVREGSSGYRSIKRVYATQNHCSIYMYRKEERG